MRFAADNPGAQFSAALQRSQDAMAHALTASMRAVTAKAVNAARANISAAGFGPRWLKATGSRVFPQGQDTLNPVGFIFNSIPFSRVFEDGAVIHGKPILWLPIEANIAASSKKITPRLYFSLFGRLTLVAHPGRKPLLYDKARKKFVFVGMESVSIRKRFDIEAAVRKAVAQFDALYAQNFVAE